MLSCKQARTPRKASLVALEALSLNPHPYTSDPKCPYNCTSRHQELDRLTTEVAPTMWATSLTMITMLMTSKCWNRYLSHEVAQKRFTLPFVLSYLILLRAHVDLCSLQDSV
jgi:hypothetical protein